MSIVGDVSSLKVVEQRHIRPQMVLYIGLKKSEKK
jgi:hypothetical protein